MQVRISSVQFHLKRARVTSPAVPESLPASMVKLLRAEQTITILTHDPEHTAEVGWICLDSGSMCFRSQWSSQWHVLQRHMSWSNTPLKLLSPLLLCLLFISAFVTQKPSGDVIFLFCGHALKGWPWINTPGASQLSCTLNDKHKLLQNAFQIAETISITVKSLICWHT